METDGPLKLLFRRYAQDLLPVTGDQGAIVHRAGPVEIVALRRRVDCVLKLEKDGEVYYHHLEFQGEVDRQMPARVFRYNGQIVLQYGAPVITTVFYLLPSSARPEPVFRVLLGGREINRWAYREVCVWELDAQWSLAQGMPGLLALIPLMKGGAERRVIEQAAQLIEHAFPGESLSDAEDVLLALAGRFYTVAELASMVGRDRMIQSSLYTEGLAEGRAEGRAEGLTEGLAEGRLEAEREWCAGLARKHHPAVFDRLESKIRAGESSELLMKWAFAASDLSDSDFLSLLGA